MDFIEYKNRKFKTFSLVLATTYPPAEGKTALDWRPFGDELTLNKIIGTHNERSISFYESQSWLPEDIENEVTILKALIDTLPTIGRLRRSHFERIQFLLIDLDAAQKETDALTTIRAQMSRRVNYVLPVNSETTPEWLRRFFEKCTCLHQPLPDAATFQKFLDRFSQIEAIVVSKLKESVPSSIDGPATEAADETYLRSLPDVSAEVRDAAMVERLNPRDAASLADGAATRERALSQIAEQIGPEHGYQVNLDPVRQPISDLASTDLQTPHLERVRLIKTTPTRPLNELPQEQQDILISLGIEQPNSAVVHHDELATHDLIESLGDAVESTSFSADLPSW